MKKIFMLVLITIIPLLLSGCGGASISLAVSALELIAR